jgi:transcriptional regulator with XRE-family HTH domain
MTSKRNGKRGDDLKSRRLAAGMSQQRLAQLADCSVSIVGLLERGLTPKHSDVLARIDAALTAARPARKEVNT